MKSFRAFCEKGPVTKTGLKLVSDVDGVLLDFSGGFTKWVKANKPELGQVDKSKWDFGIDKKKAWPAVLEFWASPEFAAGLEFFTGAKKGINELAKMFELHVVTALWPEFKQVRIKNLAGVNYKSITVMKDKLPRILSMKPDLAIEDKPAYILKMAAAGIDVYYPVIPLTAGISVGTPYRNWKQLVQIIKRKYE